MNKSVRACLLLFVMLLSVGSMQAVPAHPGAVRVQQPDGSFVTLRLHGDEWLNYTTTADGYTVVKDDRGCYVYAQMKDGRLEATAQVAHDAEVRLESECVFLSGVSKHLKPAVNTVTAAKKLAVERGQRRTQAARRAGEYNYNNFRGLIILVQFNDKAFSRDDYYEVISNMVNQEGYTGYDNEQCTGSVVDYFKDNSFGKFLPQFDIVGPYTIDYSQYSAKGTDNQEALVNAAVDAADPYVDYSQYDGDNDGYVDMIFFVFAGYGSNYGGNDSRLFWPHRYYVIKDKWYVTKDGIRLWDYASSTELYGWTQHPETVHLDGIGTFCHEFSHVLGLFDFYDSDGSGSGGEADTPESWSVMAAGSYANQSRSPVGYSLYERWAVGFLDEAPPLMNESGDYELEPLYLQGKGYRLNTPTDNEYFLIENRQQNDFKWDQFLPGSGMLVHHVDETDPEQWQKNKVNVSPSHPCYTIVRAAGGFHKNSPYDVFPGSWNVTELGSDTEPANLKSWAGEPSRCELSSITQSGSMITFHAEKTQKPDNLSEFLSETVGEEVTLQLNNAEVLYVDGNDAYIRDGQASVMFSYSGLNLQRNDILNGQVRVLVAQQNGMMQALAPEEGMDVSGLSVQTGYEEVQPHEVSIDDLDASHYSDYILLRGVRLMEDYDGLWAYLGDRRIRLLQKFGIEGLSVPNIFDGQYYDVEGIFGTDELYGDIIDGIYLTGSIVENTNPDNPTGIRTIDNSQLTIDNSQLLINNNEVYNLQGQRVAPSARGLLILRNKKLIKR